MPEDLEPKPLDELPPGTPAGPEPDGASAGTSDDAPSGKPLREEGDRPCPVCGRTMLLERRNGVRIDVCDDHGLWFDRGEFEGLLAAIRLRQRRLRGVMTKAARNQGRAEGARRGWWHELFG